MIRSDWENYFQAILVDFIFEHFGGSRLASGLPSTGYLESYFNVELVPQRYPVL